MAYSTKYMKGAKKPTPALSDWLSKKTGTNFGGKAAKAAAARDEKAGRVTERAKSTVKKDQSRMPDFKRGGSVKC
jgi:hypothetical protein